MIITILLVAALLLPLIYSILLLMRGNIFGISIAFFCLSAIFLVIFPSKSTEVANFIGVGRGTDLLLYFCFMTGGVFIFLIHARFRYHTQMITKLVRITAINSATEPNNQSFNKDSKEIKSG
jgi:hypothetical protein